MSMSIGSSTASMGCGCGGTPTSSIPTVEGGGELATPVDATTAALTPTTATATATTGIVGTSETLAALTQSFITAYDRDGDGSVTSSTELAGVAAADGAGMIAGDSDGNGVLTSAEIGAYLARFDANADGGLDQAEFSSSLGLGDATTAAAATATGGIDPTIIASLQQAIASLAALTATLGGGAA